MSGSIKPQGRTWGNACTDLLLRAGDTAMTDAFRLLVVQDFDGVAVEDGDDRVRHVGRKFASGCNTWEQPYYASRGRGQGQSRGKAGLMVQFVSYGSE